MNNAELLRKINQTNMERLKSRRDGITNGVLAAANILISDSTSSYGLKIFSGCIAVLGALNSTKDFLDAHDDKNLVNSLENQIVPPEIPTPIDQVSYTEVDETYEDQQPQI